MQTLKSQHKVLSLILAVMLVIGMMPVVTSAAEDDANSLGESTTATPGVLASPTNAGINPMAIELYNVDDIAIINNIITTNWPDNGTRPELAPTDGSSVPISWSFVNWSSGTGSQRISSLRAPSYGLTGVLDLRNLSALTYLDLTNNQLTKLDVSGCIELTSLTCAKNQLTELNVSGCTALDYLKCDQNLLAELEVSGLTALESLTCYSNQLTELDVSGCSALTGLWCYDNRLTRLNMNECTALTSLDCSENQLAELNVSDKTALTSLICGDNKLTALDVGNLTGLTRLRCFSNKLTSLDVSNLTALTNLSCNDNQLTELDVSNSPAMTSLRVSGNKLTELNLSGLDFINDYSFNRQSATLNLTANAQGSYSLAVLLNNPTFGKQSISYSNGILTSTNSEVKATTFTAQTNQNGFVLSGALNLNYGNSTDNDDSSDANDALYNPDDIAVINSLITEDGLELTLADPADGSYVPDDWVVKPPYEGLEPIVIWSSDERNKRIIELHLVDKNLSGILDVNALDKLEILECGGNPITGIDLSGMYTLKELDVYFTAITEINLADLRELERLNCSANQLTELDLSSLTKLRYFFCNSNQLTELDLTGLTDLVGLQFSNNQISEIDLSNQVNLDGINCYDNKLTELDLSKAINLTGLQCSGNQLAELDLSNNNKMYNLVCDRNMLTKLNVTGTSLGYLNCSYNKLQSKANVIGFTGKWDDKSFIFDPQQDGYAPAPPPTYPSGSGNSGSSGGSNSSSSVSTGPVNVTSATATTAVNSALAAAKAAGASTATANIKNPGDISLSTLKSMAGQAGTTPLKLQADSMNADGRTVDVRITLDPKLATNNLNLSASTTNAAAKAAETIFEKFFSNNVSVISLGQKGSFGQPVEIAAKIDPALDATNLVFYSYDKATNSYKLIPNSGYWVDKNGYVHFTTELAGDIIITDKPLAKK